MNWDALAAITSSLAFAAVLAGGFFAYGKLTRAVENIGTLLEKHDLKIGLLDQKLSEHGEKLAEHGARLEASGY